MGRAAADNRSRGKSYSNTQRGNAARRQSHSGGTKVIQALDCQSRPFSWGCKGDILFREREYPPLSRSHTVWGTTMQRCRAAIKTPLRGEGAKKAAFRLPIFSVHRAHEGRRSLLKSDIQLHAVRAHIARGVFIGMPVLGRGAALMENAAEPGAQCRSCASCGASTTASYVSDAENGMTPTW